MDVLDVGISKDSKDPRHIFVQTITNMWTMMNFQRQKWLEQSMESRRYLTGTSTADTEVGTLNWKNRTSIPKLTQIADNLHSFYMAAVMPDEDWFRWEGNDEESHQKANLIEAYMRTKLKQGEFRKALERVVRDWVFYGTCYSGVKWIDERIKSRVTDQEIQLFVGPKMFRLSPLDCVIDPKAKSFKKSVFITRSEISIADLLTHNDKAGATPQNQFEEKAVNQIKKMRGSAASGSHHDFIEFFKDEGLQIDGFGSEDFFRSQTVELLEFWGNIFNPITGELELNRMITIADRSFVLRNTENPAWTGQKPFTQCGWRILPDNLYGQSPFVQLVGMQYRADHLENLKADAFDQIVHPMIVIKGNGVDDFEFKPGGKIWVGDDGDVQFLRPEALVLQADNQIAFYHAMMEQMAGAPRDTAGIRTPGEKTALEVDLLSQNADRTFQDKLNRLEEHVIQPTLNLMFEMLVRNMDITDVARVFNDDTKALELTELTREDVVADGILRPVGAKHFAARNKRLRELNNFLNISQNQSIAVHISGLKAAQMIEQELGFEKFGVVRENIAVIEQLNTQAAAEIHQRKLQQALQEEGEETQAQPATTTGAPSEQR